MLHGTRNGDLLLKIYDLIFKMLKRGDDVFQLKKIVVVSDFGINSSVLVKYYYVLYTRNVI